MSVRLGQELGWWGFLTRPKPDDLGEVWLAELPAASSRDLVSVK